jgi:hypothetical protein
MDPSFRWGGAKWSGAGLSPALPEALDLALQALIGVANAPPT